MAQSQTAPAVIDPLVRAFIRQDYDRIDPNLHHWLDVLCGVGASECWHKKSSFKEHLFQVYKILKIWNQDDAVTKCGLFHSAYSNSYVNLAIFKADTDRKTVSDLVGTDAENLIHLFCVVPRHDLIYTELLCKLSDDNLVVPKEGVVVKHIKTGEPLHVDRYTVAQFLVMTMADFSEQLFSWQDQMFENDNGKLHYAGHNAPCLWPGEMKPGLWHSAISRMGILLRSCFDDDDAHDGHGDHANGGSSSGSAAVADQASHANGNGNGAGAGGQRPRINIPPVFDRCTKVVTEADQLTARDSYWQAVCHKTQPSQHGEALELLQVACRHNPYIAEPHVLISQIHLHARDFDAAKGHAETALRLFCEWGTCWDKRLSWDVWVAFSRVMVNACEERTWPQKDAPFGMLNLGLVADLHKEY